MPYADKAVQAGATVRQRAVPDVRALDDLAQAGRWVVTGGGQSTTAATPAGNCHQCGGQLYENLFHSCITSVAPSVSRPTSKPDGTNDPVYEDRCDTCGLLLLNGTCPYCAERCPPGCARCADEYLARAAGRETP